jgi:hypothetical protein
VSNCLGFVAICQIRTQIQACDIGTWIQAQL